jgi:hypothetical protein
MIPNALASTGPYADFWGYLKSIDHALERAMMEDTKLTALDKDRLEALASFLKGSLAEEKDDFSSEDLFRPDVCESDYSSAIDLKKECEHVPEFTEWQKSSKKGFLYKLQQLINVIEEYNKNLTKNLLSPKPPEEEFKVLQAIIQSLLSDAEIALLN